MKFSILNFIKRLAIRIKAWLTFPARLLLRRRMRILDSLGFSILSNNCLAGLLYKDARLQYKSPTVGLYFLGSAYREFVEDIMYRRMADSHFSSIDLNSLIYDESLCSYVYIHDSIPKIVFLHYTSPENAVSAWNVRLRRMIDKKHIFIFSIRDGVGEDDYSCVHAVRPETIKLGGDDCQAPGADFVLVSPLYSYKLAGEFGKCFY